jgi:hypothetical protein
VRASDATGMFARSAFVLCQPLSTHPRGRHAVPEPAENQYPAQNGRDGLTDPLKPSAGQRPRSRDAVGAQDAMNHQSPGDRRVCLDDIALAKPTFELHRLDPASCETHLQASRSTVGLTCRGTTATRRRPRRRPRAGGNTAGGNASDQRQTTELDTSEQLMRSMVTSNSWSSK